MPERLPPQDASLLAAWQIDRLCDEFESAWLSGGSPPVEDYVAKVGPDSAALLPELIALELEHRRRRGDAQAAADLRRRFPDPAVWSAIPLAGSTERRLGSTAQTLPAAPSHPASGPLPGTVIAGRYTLVSPLGEGGMGSVWIAEQSQPVKRRVALKLIKPGMDSAAVLARFEAERQALALMDHPHIAKVLDGGLTTEGRPFFVMEYVEGTPITTFCDRQRVTLEQRLRLLAPVCQAVQHAHQKGVIHRDLKPSNILVGLTDGQPTPKVIDFGLAKAVHEPLTEHSLHTAHGMLLGTPLYMSPEQADLSNADVDTRADVYSLGVVLYELLAGTTPLDPARLKAAPFDEALRLIREEEPPRPSDRLSAAPLRRAVRGELDWIAMKCLEKDRNRRYDSAAALARDVERHLQNEPVEAAPPSAAYRIGKFLRRHRGPAIAASLVLAALVAGMVGTTYGLFEARAESLRAGVALQNETTARNAAVAAGEQAVQEKQISDSVRQFVLDDMLRQAGAFAQAKTRLTTGGTFDVRWNPSMEEVLDRAAAGVTPDKIEARFPRQPQVQAAVLRTIGETYLMIGRDSDAVAHLQRAVAISSSRVGKLHLDTLELQCSLAHAYSVAQREQESFSLYRQIRDQVAGAKDSGSERARNISLLATQGVAMTQGLMGHFDESIREFSQLSATLQQGPEDERSLTTQFNMAVICVRAGRLSEGVERLEHVHQVRCARWGPENPESLITACNLAGAYTPAGRPGAAIALLKPLMTSIERQFGPAHGWTREAWYDLGSAHWLLKHFPEAIEAFERALEITRRLHGEGSLEALEGQVELATVRREAGEKADNRDLYRRLYEKQQQQLGPEHRRTLYTLHQLARQLGSVDELPESIRLLEQVHGGRTRTLGPDHPETLLALHDLAVAHGHSHRQDLAIPLLQELIRRETAALPPGHRDLIFAKANLGINYCDMKRYSEAIPYLEEAIRKMDVPAYRRALSEKLLNAYIQVGKKTEAGALIDEIVAAARATKSSQELAGALTLGGQAWLQLQAWRDADQLLAECVNLCEEKLPQSSFASNARSLFGYALAMQKQFAEAEPLLLDGYKELKQREGKPKAGEQGLAAAALNRLIELYVAWDKPEEAAKWRKEAEGSLP